MAFSITRSLATASAVPLDISDFEPPVPLPACSRSESVCIRRIFAGAIPSRSPTICANGVQWPWPWSCEPVSSVIAPSVSKWMAPSSFTTGAVISRNWPMPRPRSRPRRALSDLRAAKPAQSLSSSALSRMAGKLPQSKVEPEACL